MCSNLWSKVKWLAFIVVAGTLFAMLANAPYVEAQARSTAQLAVLQSDPNRIVLEFQASSYETREMRVGSETFALYSIGDLGHTTEPGNPQLPLKGAMVAIPPGAQATFKILDDQTQTNATARPPIPQPTASGANDPGKTLPDPPTATYTRNATTYSANRLYPAASAKLGDTGNWRSQHYVTVQFFPLQYNGATRQLVLHRRVRVEITLTYARGQSPATIGGAVNEGAFESTFEKAFINYPSARNWRARTTGLTPRAPSAPRDAGVCPNGTGPCYKIGVDTDAMYKVSCDQLTGASSVVSNTLRMFKNGTELAIKVVGAWGGSCTTNDYVEFFGKGLTQGDASFKYANTNIYWLTYGINPGLRMPTRDGSDPGGTTAATTFTKTVRIEQNLIYRSYIPMAEADHWYWTFLYSSTPIIPSYTQADYPFSMDSLATGSFTATLQVVIQGFTTSHRTITSINGTQIADTSWSGAGEHVATIPFTQSLMTTTNTIHLNQVTAGNGAMAYLNNFTITYASAFSATNNALRFQQPITNSWLYSVTNFSSPAIEAFDITNPYSVTRIISGSVAGTGPYSFQFADSNSSPRDYIAVSAAGVKTLPSMSVSLDVPSDLKKTSNGADYIILAASSLTSSVQSLATLRSGQFPRPAKLVDAQDVYDEFSDGLVTPQAIRDFLLYAYNNWTAPAPAYVLLVGSGTYDPKGYCASGCLPGTWNAITTTANLNLLPPLLKMVDPFINYTGETATDNCLVSFAADCTLITHTLPYMHIGRLPADSPADVTALVNKIMAYENPPAGAWRWTSSFVSDNFFNANGSVDSGGNFYFYSDEIVANPAYYPASLTGQRIYYNPCTDTVTYPWCALPYSTYSTVAGTHNAILSAINAGRLIVNYVGHGFYTYWGETGFFEVSDLSSLTNGNKTPIMLELTCRTGYFLTPVAAFEGRSLAKQNVNLPNNGAVASWASTGVGLVTGHDLLEKGFFDSVMNQNQRRLGPATLAGKVMVNSSGENLDLLDTTILFGDPATKVAIQVPIYFPLIFR